MNRRQKHALTASPAHPHGAAVEENPHFPTVLSKKQADLFRLARTGDFREIYKRTMMTDRVSVMRAATILILTAFCVSGCTHTMVEQSVVERYSKDSEEAQMDFLHELNNVPIASNDDGFHAVLLYFDGKDPSPDYAARLATLKSRQLLPADFNQPANQALQRGTLAVILAHALHIKGGMMMHVASYTPRYAVRELYYENLYPPSSPQQLFSGAEVLGIMGRVEDYQRGDSADKSATRLPGESAN